MKKIIPLFAGLALSACATQYAPMAHYNVPAVCTPEALAKITLTVIEVAKLSHKEEGVSVGDYGQWDNRTSQHVIWILKGLPADLHQEVLDHERCHELMFQLTGNGEWHGHR